jgi:kinesin family protein C1
LQQQKEHQIVDENMKLHNDRAALDLEIIKLQKSLSHFEDELKKKDAQIEKLENSSDLLQDKARQEAELRIKDLEQKHSEIIAKLEEQFKVELFNELERARTQKEQQLKQERDLLQQEFSRKEAQLKELLETERKEHHDSMSEYKSSFKEKYRALKEKRNELQLTVDTLQHDRDKYRDGYETLEAEMKSVRLELSRYQTETESSTNRYQDKVKQLETQLREQHESMLDFELTYETMKKEHAGSKEKLLKAEAARRKLHNQLQDLKGNIRVYCRVRPLLATEAAAAPVKLVYPDEDEEGQRLQISLPNVGGIPSLENPDIASQNKIYSFKFDRVFNPRVTNETLFEDVSQLVQSALDGYNVCIFAYGQTGSGKTFTMSSPTNGIIPLAIRQIFATAAELTETGWSYEFHGEFLEIYNEKIIDLLGKSSLSLDDQDIQSINNPRGSKTSSKYEIRHDPVKRSTKVLGLTSVRLENYSQAARLLQQATRNRSVAATQMNERSSRSHSVFVLRLSGSNALTGKRHDGVLNLIDLAGSERLAHSQASGDRLRETQAINKSLSSLGDVIVALGSSANNNNNSSNGHIPYRNSKLTYLLQYSLSGNSKTLMLVNVSPLQQHANETINSLRFATKVSFFFFFFFFFFLFLSPKNINPP